MVEINKIYNEDCFETMRKIGGGNIDVILTSPFYNTNEKAGKSRTLQNTKVKDGQYNHVRYDVHCDNMTSEEYVNFTVKTFNEFSKILKKNGVVLYNMSYGSKGCDNLIDVVHSVIHKTDFTLADTIVWKKRSALPNSCSPNKLTRIWEFVFVFCRKDEFMTFNSNKKVTSVRKTGQKAYSNIFNFVEARNNDGTCAFNKATFSTELCEKLLAIYAKEGSVVYDPFCGTGTTCAACKKNGMNYIGSEISENQVKFANERLMA